MNLKPEELVKALREDCKTCSENPICENGTNLAGLYCANKDAADQIERDQNEIEALREKQRWISVTEKTPEYDMPQLALNADGDALIANYAYGEWFDTWGQDVEVTHWMPLPEQPKED